MRFESIKMENYRQYEDLFFSFEKKKDTDLHIIVASNGVGKTNLLNSICWCLYGDEPHLGDESESLPICNLKGLEKAAETGEKAGIVKVEIIATTGTKQYTFTRTVPVNVDTYFVGKDLFKIVAIDSMTGETEIDEDKQADDKMRFLLPKEIRDYFFFDAEQLFNYFKPREESTAFVKDAIHTLAQVKLVGQVIDHLSSVIKKEYQTPLEKMNPKIAEIKDEKEKAEALLLKYREDIDATKISIQESRDKIEDNNRLINGAETVVDDNKKYNTNLTELDNIAQSREMIMGKFQELIQKYIPLLYLYKVNEAANEFIQSKKNVLLPEVNTKLLIQSVREHVCACCKTPLSDEKEKEMQDIVDKLEWSTDVSDVLNTVRNEIAGFLEEAKNYKKEKEALMDELRKLDDRVQLLEDENSRLYSKIMTYSNIDGIELLMSERDEHRDLLESNTKKLGVYENKVVDIKKEIQGLEDKYDKAVKEQNDSEILKNTIVFANRGLSIIKEIHEEMVSEVRTQMEDRTLELFKQFIQNEAVPFKYSRVKLTENYKLELYHAVTNTSCMGSCSAAERQMLALAFTIALHQVSHYDSLLFIDTPVGRVSDINRKNFARILVEISKGKQMIFTFTPSEFSDEIRGYFNENVRSTYRTLATDNSKVMEV